MVGHSSSPAGHGNGDPTMTAGDVVDGFRNLAEVDPQAATAHLDHVAEKVESSRSARIRFISVVGDIIVGLPPEGARYPAQVLAELVSDECIAVREEACKMVGKLAAVLGPSHIRQCRSMFAATAQRLGSEDHVFVCERAGAAWLTLVLGHDGIGLASVALIITALQQILPGRTMATLEQAVEWVEMAKAPVTTVPTAG